MAAASWTVPPTSAHLLSTVRHHSSAYSRQSLSLGSSVVWSLVASACSGLREARFGSPARDWSWAPAVEPQILAARPVRTTANDETMSPLASSKMNSHKEDRKCSQTNKVFIRREKKGKYLWIDRWGRLREKICFLVVVWITYIDISSRFPFGQSSCLPGSESVFGLSPEVICVLQLL